MGVRLSGHVLMLDVLCIVELSVQVIVDADRAATRLICLIEISIVYDFNMHVWLALRDHELHSGHLILLFIMAR